MIGIAQHLPQPSPPLPSLPVPSVIEGVCGKHGLIKYLGLQPALMRSLQSTLKQLQAVFPSRHPFHFGTISVLAICVPRNRWKRKKLAFQRFVNHQC